MNEDELTIGPNIIRPTPSTAIGSLDEKDIFIIAKPDLAPTSDGSIHQGNFKSADDILKYFKPQKEFEIVDENDKKVTVKLTFPNFESLTRNGIVQQSWTLTKQERLILFLEHIIRLVETDPAAEGFLHALFDDPAALQKVSQWMDSLEKSNQRPVVSSLTNIHQN